MKYLKSIHEHSNNVKGVSKKLILSVVLLLTVSLAFTVNDVTKVSTSNNEETIELVNSIQVASSYYSFETSILNVNCESACVDYADNRDDGSDRTNRNWQNDLDTCRGSCEDV